MKLSLKYKLIGLILFSISLSLGITVVAFDYYIKEIFINENKQNIVNSFQNTSKELRKLEKEVEIILIFALMFLRFKKSNLLSSRFQDELITVLSLAIPFNFVSNNRIPLF